MSFDDEVPTRDGGDTITKVQRGGPRTEVVLP